MDTVRGLYLYLGEDRGGIREQGGTEDAEPGDGHRAGGAWGCGDGISVFDPGSIEKTRLILYYILVSLYRNNIEFLKSKMI